MPHAPDSVDKAKIDTLVDEKGLPPIPHEHWVDRLGFQQPDPVTDFRSGGVLSLAMMVHIVETCPTVHERYVRGDAAVLPFGITCINVTDMLAKFCMLAKSVDRMDALLSQKPFWRMFADPNSILALQELALDMLADVVVELAEERQIPGHCAPDDTNANHSLHNDKEEPGKVTVFDFSLIMERTEKRVEKDLLGAGPKSVEELQAVRVRLKQRYKTQLQRLKQRAEQQLENQLLQQQQQSATDTADEENNATGDDQANIADATTNGVPAATGRIQEESRKVAGQVMNVASGATSMAAGVFAKIKSPVFNPLRKQAEQVPTDEESSRPTIVTTDLPPSLLEPDLITFSPNNDNIPDEDGDWVTSPMRPPTDAIEHFSIDDDDDDML